MYYGGLRVSEVAQFTKTMCDTLISDQKCDFLQPKTNKIKTIPIPQEAVEDLKSLMFDIICIFDKHIFIKTKVWQIFDRNCT